MGGAGRGALTVDGEPWGQADVPASGNAWTPLALGTRALRAGPHTLRLWVREGGFDLERLTVDLATTD